SLPPGDYTVEMIGDRRFAQLESPAEVRLQPGEKHVVAVTWLPPGELARLQGHDRRVISLALSPSGDTLASGTDTGAIRLWSTSRDELLYKLEAKPGIAAHSKSGCRVAFSPDGKLLVSAGWDKSVKWWDVATGQF